ncbi:hypothetical protein ACLOJK_009806 [Asimina triloba]
MASGSSGRSAAGSKGFDFGTDDVLCSYDDFSNQEASNGKRSDSAIGGSSGKCNPLLDLCFVRMHKGFEMVVLFDKEMENRQLIAHVQTKFLTHLMYLSGAKLSSTVNIRRAIAVGIRVGTLPVDVIRGRTKRNSDFRDSRMGRSALNLYNQQEESFNQDILSSVERTMKKHSDNLLRYLEGISGRLSQLELYCYNLERSIGDFRSDLIRDHNESDLKLRSLEKHLQEVHRSVQILRDKQEIADAQKELAKFQLVQKESLHHNEEGGASSAELKKHENASEAQSQQLALALPQQTTVPTSLPTPSQPYKELPVQQQPVPSIPLQQQIHVQSHPNTYYPQPTQLPSQPPPQMDPHLQVGLQYAPQRPQMQQAPQPQPHVSPAQTPPQFTPYQQQWPQQAAQQFPPQSQPQQHSSQAPVRPQTPPTYPSYPQPTNPSPEAYTSSMPMQIPYSSVPPSRPEPPAYGFGGPAGRSTQPQAPLPPPSVQRHPPTQVNQSSFGAPVGDAGYPGGAPLPPQSSPMHGYMIYEPDSGRSSSHQPHFQQSGYPPTHVSALPNQPLPPAGLGARHPSSHMIRNHPYAEMIEKAAGMGYQRDQVANAIHRMEESGQPVDFNSLLDRLDSRY